MTVTVRLFASLRERTGVSTLERDIAEGSTVADLIAELETAFPALENRGRIAVAVNSEYTELAHRLTEGDEVALIPPVSGGCHAAHRPE
jgi:molybdopterin converting factor subunit 1